MREGEMRLEIGFVRPVGCLICLLPCSELKEVDCDFRADGTCLGSGEDTFEFSDDLIGGRMNDFQRSQNTHAPYDRSLAHTIRLVQTRNRRSQF